MKRLFIFISFFVCLQAFAQNVPAIKIAELEQKISSSNKPLVVCFWASWCKPCIAEIPVVQEAVQQYKSDSVQLILVSLDMEDDYPAAIQKTILQRKFTAPVYWLNETNADYFCPRVDPKWSGAIPASLIINNKTGQRLFFEEPLTPARIESALMAILGK